MPLPVMTHLPDKTRVFRVFAATRSVRTTIYIVVLAVTVSVAHAGTPEDRAKQLDAYDYALNEAYRQLLENLSVDERKQLKQVQRDWLVQRDKACRIQTRFKGHNDYIASVSKDRKMLKCALKQTKDRVKTLRAKLQRIFDLQYHPVSGKSYPPYPDVWSRQINTAFPRTAAQVYRTKGGDYLIISTTKQWSHGTEYHTISNAVYFFSGKSQVALTDEELKKLWVGNTPIRGDWKIVKADKLQIGTTSLDSRQPARCPQDLNAYFFVKDGPSQGRFIKPNPPYRIRKSLLVRNKHPIKVPINELCTDTLEKSYLQYVTTRGAWFYEYLDDGTLLAFVSGNPAMILRMTDRLETQPNNRDKEYLWLPTSEVEKLMQFESDKPYQDAQNAALKKFH